MFERQNELDVVYAPWEGLDPDEAIQVSAQWLNQQPGHPLILLHAKKMYSNNPLLPRLTAGVQVERPQSVFGSGWRGGPVLAPWPSEGVLAALSDELAHMMTSACIVEWGEQQYQSAWLAAHHAVNLATGEVAGSKALLSPVVEVAMRRLSEAVNHNNGLVSYYEKSYAVRTLQELARAGHQYQIDDLCAWALANGFTLREVEQLRKYATGVQAGRSFQLRVSVGPRPGDGARWEEEATRGGVPPVHE